MPAFPPKFYLAMTKSATDERQSQLEQYLQNVTLDSNITNNDIFIDFFRKLQQTALLPPFVLVVKKVADFELSYVSLQSMKDLHCKLEIRKWYVDPSLDILLMDCSTSLNFLYIQGATKDGKEDTLKPRFEYNDSGTWQWIILYTKQPFALSSCLKKMVSEQMMKADKGQEMKIKMPESTKNRNKKSSTQQKQEYTDTTGSA